MYTLPRNVLLFNIKNRYDYSQEVVFVEKKIIVVGGLLALSLLFTGCGKSEGFDAAEYSISESGTWVDGTYTESADGKNGKFDVTVVISDGKLDEIKIGNHDETPDKGGKAIAQMPDEMISQQSVSVDAVSGATVTSDAIREAVAKCLEAASTGKE